MKIQTNHKTKQAYQGKNQANLLGAKENNDYKSNDWLTFVQARELKLKIKKGSKGVAIFKGFNTVNEKTKDGKIKTVSIPSGFARVFNLDCTEKYNIKKTY